MKLGQRVNQVRNDNLTNKSSHPNRLPDEVYVHDAKNIAKTLLPDILSYDPRRPVSFPHNGRTLTDDVADVFFSMYANRNVTDKVGPHRDLLDDFPYLGPPHSVESNSHNATSGGKHGKQG